MGSLDFQFGASDLDLDYDVLIVGAGLSGIYSLYRMRKLGMRVKLGFCGNFFKFTSFACQALAGCACTRRRCLEDLYTHIVGKRIGMSAFSLHPQFENRQQALRVLKVKQLHACMCFDIAWGEATG